MYNFAYFFCVFMGVYPQKRKEKNKMGKITIKFGKILDNTGGGVVNLHYIIR